MTAQAVLVTAGLLGAYVLCGGIYGVCYAVKDVVGGPIFGRLSAAAYVVQTILALIVIGATPLGIGWKWLIAVSTAAYAVIPAVTLHYLRRLHTG